MCWGPLAESTPGIFHDSPHLIDEKNQGCNLTKVRKRIHGRIRDLNQAMLDSIAYMPHPLL